MKINVQYPTVIEKTTLVKADRMYNPWKPENNKDRMVTFSTPVNQEYKIYVKKVERLVQEEFMTNDDYCKEQTGTTPAAYQAKFKRAWND